MANEIWTSFEEGETLYALIFRKTNDKVYDAVAGSDTFDTYTDADIDDYDVALANQADSDYYSVDFPSGISAGVYRIQILLQVGSSINADDDIVIAQGEIYWDGTAEFDLFIIGREQRKNLIIEDDTEKTKTTSIASTGRLITEGPDC